MKELESSLLAKLLLDDSNSKSGRGEGHGGRFSIDELLGGEYAGDGVICC